MDHNRKKMALRRPPTRIELKADDIAEYHEVSVSCRGHDDALIALLAFFALTRYYYLFVAQLKKEQTAAEAAKSKQAKDGDSAQFSLGRSPMNAVEEEKKAKAAERIGVSTRRRGR